MTNDRSIEKKLEIGALLMIGMRWGIRFMGLFNTVILARLLTPGDFGIIAMVMVFQSLIEGLINLNVQLVLIRKQDAEKIHYDTAWTIGIIQFGVIAGILLAGSEWVGAYYQEPRLPQVIQVIAIAIFLRGLVNIGIVDFRKDLRFSLDLKYEMLTQGIRVVATIGFAFWLRSYWAMVLGILTGSLAAVLLSYRMSAFRPRPGLARWREVFGVSVGVWLTNLNRFFSMQVDRLILGRLLPTDALGGYSVAIDLARLPSAELIVPLSRALVPGYAKVKGDQARMDGLFLTLLSAASLFAAPIAYGFPIVAGDFTQVVLGTQWAFIVPMLRIGAVLAVVELMAGVNRPLLLAVGEFRPLNIILSVETLVIVTVVYPAFQWRGTEGVLLALTAVRLAALFGLFLLSAHTLRLALRVLLAPMARPLLAGLVMASVLVLVPWPDMLPLLRLVLTVLVGGVVYGLMVWFMWYLAGRPHGFERTVIDRVGGFLGPKLRRLYQG